MPAEERSAALTDAYRARLAALRRRALVAVDAEWNLDLDDLDASFLAWLARAEFLLELAQEAAGELSVAYVAAFVGSELDLDEPSPAVDVDGTEPAGETMDGRPLVAVLSPALYTVKARLAAGAPFEVASTSGRARALRNATTELSASADRSLDEAIAAEPRIRGWRRVTSSRACGACLGAATGAVQQKKTPILRHPHCSCTKEPVVAGVRERVRRPTGAEMFDRLDPADQDALFAGRGGKAKAELVRSGRVSVSDLVSTDRQALDGRTPILTETPLDNLSR